MSVIYNVNKLAYLKYLFQGNVQKSLEASGGTQYLDSFIFCEGQKS